MNSPKNPIIDRVNPRMFRSELMQRCKLHECKGACCIFGVWADLREVDDIMQNAALIRPHMPEDARNPGEWFTGMYDEDPHSPSGRVIHTGVENRLEHYGNTACVFWLTDGKCALQVAAVENGLHPWRFKPFYCILHPLDLDEQGRITLDETDEMIHEQGSCLIPADRPIPLIETFEPEFRYLLGEKGYQALVEIVRQQNSSE